MRDFENDAVARIFDAYPASIRDRLLALRELVFDTAAATDGVGELEETLKWGEPAYVTARRRSGSTIRIDWKQRDPSRYAIYFHCRTRLVETFRTHFPDTFEFEGNRAIVFQESDVLPTDPLRACIAMALTYHLRKPSSL